MKPNVWTKSSRCESGACVEARFVKSTRSCDSANCVEVATCDCHVQVRNSKDPAGPVLTFTHEEWRMFLAGARDGEFDV